MIGTWLRKTRTRRDASQLAQERDDLRAQILQANWTVPAPE
ncbi:hypothetical protein FB157_10423 [Streptomyces sp. BK340]|nr:hypothetical protein FB157_10423 [Streptomyces sp. BK340]